MQRAQVMDVVEAEAATRPASLRIITPVADAVLPGFPAFQRRNMTMAIAAYRYVAERDGLGLLAAETILRAGSNTPPGRMERCTVGDKEVILDGAHNPQKLRALRLSLEESGIQSAIVLASLVQAPQQKIDDSLAELQPLAAHLIIPEFSVVQDIGKQSVSADELAARARCLGMQSVEICPELSDAVAILLQRPEPTLLVTGSLYLVSQVRALLQEL
jgi:dihydrofolate synthase / folylpolyglutamate synthase